MIVHNRNIFNVEQYEGSGLIDTVLSLVNGVIQHKDVIKDVVNIGKDIKTLTQKQKPIADTNTEQEIPEDVKNIITKIKTLSERHPTGEGLPPDGFRYI